MANSLQYFDLPQEMRDRMPSAYTKVIKLPIRHPLYGEALYDAILELVLSYHLNYGMKFPENNQVAMLTQMVRHLSLPGMSNSTQCLHFNNKNSQCHRHS